MTAPTRRSTPTVGRPAAVALAVVGLLLATGLLVACGAGSSGSTGSSAATAGRAGEATGTVTVFAAASLKDAFTEAATAFEAENPDADVTFAFAASSALARQIREGAPADAFASADQANMQEVVEAGGISGDPVVFATNSLEIIVAPGNPKGITGLADLSRAGVLYVTAGPEVPIGTYAAQALEKAGVTVSPVSQEADVKAVVTKVTSGEADAAIVYATDVTAAGARAEGVEIPSEYQVQATYPLAVTTEAANPTGAAAWIAFLTGEQGRAILAAYGFGAS